VWSLTSPSLLAGPTLLHYVRNAPFYQEMPVVMMSSNEHADVVLNCIRLVGLCTLNQVDP
jgi:hypothetical protein